MLNTSANYGVRIAKDGFANFTLEYVTRNKTNRPSDPVKYLGDIYREQFGDASANNFAGYVNSAIPLAENYNFYFFGGYNSRHTDAFAWTRASDDPTGRNVLAIYPNGFNPHITSKITDYSLSTGIRTKLNGWDVDLNNTIGSNRFHYTIENTLNASLLAASPTKFDAGVARQQGSHGQDDRANSAGQARHIR